jgi:hypothetical protein
MQVWPDVLAGLQARRRALKAGGRIALGFTPHSRQPSAGLTEMLSAAGLSEGHLVQADQSFCVLAIKL